MANCGLRCYFACRLNGLNNCNEFATRGSVRDWFANV